MNVKNDNRARRPAKPKKSSPIRSTRNSPAVMEPSTRANARYLKLATIFPIRPLSSDAELDQAIGVLDQLLSRKNPLDQQEQGYLDSLSHEIERYEAVNVPIPDVSGAAMLRHLIEARDITLSDLATTTGIVISTLSSVLNGKRELNRRHIEKLAPYFGVSPGVFLS
jgi:HTH-type transcriptional regulator / antitoxin HigA